MHELDDLVFAPQLRQRVLLLTVHKILKSWETGDFEAIGRGLVHGGVHGSQNTRTLQTLQKANLKVVQGSG